MASVPTTDSTAARAARFVIRDVLFDVVRFPIWWYTAGVRLAARFVQHELLALGDRLSIRILLRNLFKPMFGDYSRSGRAISFFVRLIVFVFKSIWLAAWTVVLLGLFLLWFIVPVAAVYQLVLQITG